MEQEKTILTDEQIEAITKELGDAASPTTENLRKIMAEGEHDDEEYPKNVMDKKVEKVVGTVEIDPNTGERKIAMNTTMQEPKVTLDDIVSGEDLVKLEDISDETVMESLKSMDIKDKEALDTLELIKRNDKGESVKYNELTPTIQRMVDGLRGTSGENGMKIPVKTIIKDVLSFLKTQLQQDQEYINLQNVLEKEIKGANLFTGYTEEMDENMTTKMRELADKAKEQSPEKAEQLYAIADAYEDAKDFKLLTDALDRNDKCTRKLDREVKRFNKYIRDFNFKYNTSKFTIPGLELTLKVLQRHTKSDKCVQLLIMYCKLIMNMKSDDVVDHITMYYTLRNMCNLDIYNMESELYKETLTKIESILERL